MRARTKAGFTLIELLVVIGIISLLMVALFTALSKFRQRTQLGQAKNLVEKLHSGLAAYHMQFRAYPPASFAGKTESAALLYFLTTPFRTAPNAAANEEAATINAGPFITLDEREMKNDGGLKKIVDPWGIFVMYKLESILDAAGYTIPVPVIYSFGTNKADDAGAGDDIGKSN